MFKWGYHGMPRTIRLILGDQLTPSLDIVKHADFENDVFLMAEVREEATHIKHHKKKIAFIFSAMRHFAKSLKQLGAKVRYITISDPQNTNSLLGETARAIKDTNINQLVVTEPSEYRLREELEAWKQRLALPITILPDTRFLATHHEFQSWANGKKQLRMEMFYREMRQKHNILMAHSRPIGGKWNYDAQNQKAFKGEVDIPQGPDFVPDGITKQVIREVSTHFPEHFGHVEPFNFAVTREQALQALDAFIQYKLPHFGDFQDAMKQDEPFLFHSLLSAYLNCGLLTPLEIIIKAQNAYLAHKVPINAAEGFIRQILGWREFVRGIYWLFMPDYLRENYFDAKRALPSLYWGKPTKMNCLYQCVKETQENAYAHHIQRLMILGNFAALCQVSPSELQDWFWSVYIDAFEWVELPNVTGMALFADGGKLASKPYISSGNYINKMSDYCNHCHYDVKQKQGDKACPFNYLYWHFLLENEDKLSSNHRMRMPLNTLVKMPNDKKNLIKKDALIFLSKINDETNF